MTDEDKIRLKAGRIGIEGTLEALVDQMERWMVAYPEAKTFSKREVVDMLKNFQAQWLEYWDHKYGDKGE